MSDLAIWRARNIETPLPSRKYSVAVVGFANSTTRVVSVVTTPRLARDRIRPPAKSS